MMTNDPLSVKREKLARLIAAKNQARLRAMGQNPTLDFDTSVFEHHSSVERTLHDLRFCDEATLDQLTAYHDPAGSGQPRYVW